MLADRRGYPRISGDTRINEDVRRYWHIRISEDMREYQKLSGDIS